MDKCVNLQSDISYKGIMRLKNNLKKDDKRILMTYSFKNKAFPSEPKPTCTFKIIMNLINNKLISIN